MERSDRTTTFVRVSGQVQGVGFRAWTQSQARSLDIDGWVRNDADGCVTAAFAGEAASIDTMIERLRQGPPGSSVERVEIGNGAAGALPSGFEIRR